MRYSLKFLVAFFLSFTLILGAGDTARAVDATDEHGPKQYEINPNTSPEKIMQRLVGDDYEAYLGFVPTISSFNSLIPNAYALPGHKIMLSKSLLGVIKNEDQLAFILAHEIGHLRLHSGKRQMQALGGTTSRQRQELEADTYALQLLSESGYDRTQAINVLETLSHFGSEYGVGLGTLFSGLDGRIANIKVILSK